MTIDFNALKAPFDPSLISWRVGAMTKNKDKAIALAYIDARDVMERLDEVCGPGNWQALYPHANGKTSCKIGIKVGDEWVWKENGSGDSDIEAEKGAFSDAFKRSAVLWGIGRYLYDVENNWFEVDQYKKFTNPNDRRFAESLAKAAKGIRSTGTPAEPEIKQMDGEEFAALQKEIKAVKNNEELAEVRNKLTSAKPRMTKEQINVLAKEISAKGTQFVIDDHKKMGG